MFYVRENTELLKSTLLVGLYFFGNLENVIQSMKNALHTAQQDVGDLNVLDWCFGVLVNILIQIPCYLEHLFQKTKT